MKWLFKNMSVATAALVFVKDGGVGANDDSRRFMRGKNLFQMVDGDMCNDLNLCQNSPEKVLICHHGDEVGNLCIAKSAAQSHLRQHDDDHCGECNDVDFCGSSPEGPAECDRDTGVWIMLPTQSPSTSPSKSPSSNPSASPSMQPSASPSTSSPSSSPTKSPSKSPSSGPSASPSSSPSTSPSFAPSHRPSVSPSASPSSSPTELVPSKSPSMRPTDLYCICNGISHNGIRYWDDAIRSIRGDDCYEKVVFANGDALFIIEQTDGTRLHAFKYTSNECVVSPADRSGLPRNQVELGKHGITAHQAYQCIAYLEHHATSHNLNTC